MELYSDRHPNRTMKGTGFKDEKTAHKTIQLIHFRSPAYQFSVINTMNNINHVVIYILEFIYDIVIYKLYNRAKYHPHQTSDMRIAMKVFSEWLKKYKKPKIKYSYMSKDNILSSGVKSEFINKLEEVGWKYHKLQYLPVRGKYNYLSWRNSEIDKLLKRPDSKTPNKLLKFAYAI